MAVGVIDGLEVIQIHNHYRQFLLLIGQRRRQPVIKRAAIGNTGQRIPGSLGLRHQCGFLRGRSLPFQRRGSLDHLGKLMHAAHYPLSWQQLQQPEIQNLALPGNPGTGNVTILHGCTEMQCEVGKCLIAAHGPQKFLTA